MNRCRVMALLCGVVALMACRDHPYYVGPEHLVLDINLGPEVVKQTVVGRVHCATCAPNATSMLIDLYLPDRDTSEPIATESFGQLGAYRITGTVPYGERLEIRATIFTAGGLRTKSALTEATDDKDLDEATVTLDLVLP